MLVGGEELVREGICLCISTTVPDEFLLEET